MDSEEDRIDPNSPGLRIVTHARTRLVFGILGCLLSVGFLLHAFADLPIRRHTGGAFTAYVAFWGLGLIGNLFTVRRALRGVRDPAGEIERIDDRHRRLREQPRTRQMLQAGLVLALFVVAFVAVGVLVLTTTHDGTRFFGWVFIALAGVLVAIAAWRVRHPLI